MAGGANGTRWCRRAGQLKGSGHWRPHTTLDSDSKSLWLSIRRSLKEHDVRLGQATAQAYIDDPRMLAFIAARYKFVAKMLAGSESVIEAGCGDAFGAPIVAQSVGRLLCTDIDQETIESNAKRHAVRQNIRFAYHDFRAGPVADRAAAVFSVDVLEHIYPAEEERFVANLVASLAPHGIMLTGTPNIAGEQYASAHSKLGHVNLKSATSLRDLMGRFFHNVFMFSMNDEVVHTGYAPMAHYIWSLAVGPKAND